MNEVSNKPLVDEEGRTIIGCYIRYYKYNIGKYIYNNNKTITYIY